MLTFGVVVLGATDRPRAEAFWSVLADTEGNRLCIVDLGHESRQPADRGPDGTAAQAG